MYFKHTLTQYYAYSSESADRREGTNSTYKLLHYCSWTGYWHFLKTLNKYVPIFARLDLKKACLGAEKMW